VLLELFVPPAKASFPFLNVFRCVGEQGTGRPFRRGAEKIRGAVYVPVLSRHLHQSHSFTNVSPFLEEAASFPLFPTLALHLAVEDRDGRLVGFSCRVSLFHFSLNLGAVVFKQHFGSRDFASGWLPPRDGPSPLPMRANCQLSVPSLRRLNRVATSWRVVNRS